MTPMVDPVHEFDEPAIYEEAIDADGLTPLAYSSDEYLATVHRGVFVVLSSIIAQIIIGFGMFAALALYQSRTNQRPPTAAYLPFIAIQFVAGVAFLWGWWLASSVDSDVPPEADAPQSRQWLRITIIIQLAANVAVLLPQSGLLTQAPTGPVLVVTIALSVISTGASVAAFFAQMVYVRWLGERIPNKKVVERARRLMWLGPVLYTFGLLLLALGPLIALVLYWNMLEWVRKDLKQIRTDRADSWSPEQSTA